MIEHIKFVPLPGERGRFSGGGTANGAAVMASAGAEATGVGGEAEAEAEGGGSVTEGSEWVRSTIAGEPAERRSCSAFSELTRGA